MLAITHEDTIGQDMQGCKIEFGSWSKQSIARALCIDDSRSRLLKVDSMSDAVIRIDMTERDSRGAGYNVKVPRQLTMCALGHVQKII